MEEENKATEASAQPIATGEIVEDAESRVAALEAEKAKLIEEAANYKVAYLKEQRKNKEASAEEDDDEERMRKVAVDVMTKSRLAEIAREQDGIIKKALKENKELKLAMANKSVNTPPAAMGTHSESVPVRDTLISSEQLNAFKARGWTDKDIERYKKNLQRNFR